MTIRRLVLLLGISYLLTGLWTLAAPGAWYRDLPGVSATGPMNVHFVEDIGFATLASGVLFVLGARRGSAQLAAAGALWPALHAFIHLAGWLHEGLPADPAILLTETVGVVGLSVLGLVLGWLRLAQEGERRTLGPARA